MPNNPKNIISLIYNQGTTVLIHIRSQYVLLLHLIIPSIRYSWRKISAKLFLFTKFEQYVIIIVIPDSCQNLLNLK